MITTRSKIEDGTAKSARHSGRGFDEREFLRCLLTEANATRPIGDVLQEELVPDGIEMRRRFEILGGCRIDPCQFVEELTATKLERLCRLLARCS